MFSWDGAFVFVLFLTCSSLILLFAWLGSYAVVIEMGNKKGVSVFEFVFKKS